MGNSHGSLILWHCAIKTFAIVLNLVVFCVYVCVDVKMEFFSLEHDGLFIPDEQKPLSEDPFENVADLPVVENSNSQPTDCKYSYISDVEDFDIPCSQIAPPDRSVVLIVIFCYKYAV